MLPLCLCGCMAEGSIHLHHNFNSIARVEVHRVLFLFFHLLSVCLPSSMHCQFTMKEALSSAEHQLCQSGMCHRANKSSVDCMVDGQQEMSVKSKCLSRSSLLAGELMLPASVTLPTAWLVNVFHHGLGVGLDVVSGDQLLLTLHWPRGA